MHFSTDGRQTIHLKIPFSPLSPTWRQLFQLDNFHREVTSSLLFSWYRLRKTANINGKKTSQFKPISCKDSKILQETWTYITAKIISRTRHMYGHEVLMSLQTRAKFFGTHFLHSFVSDVRLWRMTDYSMENAGNAARLPVSFQMLTMLTFR
jgi:hypothetical protein